MLPRVGNRLATCLVLERACGLPGHRCTGTPSATRPQRPSGLAQVRSDACRFAEPRWPHSKYRAHLSADVAYYSGTRAYNLSCAHIMVRGTHGRTTDARKV